MLDEKQQDQDDDEDDPKHLHPAWCAIGRSAIEPHAGCGAGLDVHKKTVVVHVRITDAKGRIIRQTRTFSTMTADLLALSDWLTTLEITHVAMESTGEYWKPVYALLEGAFSVLVVNAAHIK